MTSRKNENLKLIKDLDKNYQNMKSIHQAFKASLCEPAWELVVLLVRVIGNQFFYHFRVSSGGVLREPHDEGSSEMV